MTSIPGYCINRGIAVQKVSISPYFTPQTTKKGGVNMRFQAKHAKYSNCCVIKTTNAIPTKFSIVIKTTNSRCWLCAVEWLSRNQLHVNQHSFVNCILQLRLSQFGAEDHAATPWILWIKAPALLHPGPISHF